MRRRAGRPESLSIRRSPSAAVALFFFAQASVDPSRPFARIRFPVGAAPPIPSYSPSSPSLRAAFLAGPSFRIHRLPRGPGGLRPHPTPYTPEPAPRRTLCIVFLSTSIGGGRGQTGGWGGRRRADGTGRRCREDAARRAGRLCGRGESGPPPRCCFTLFCPARWSLRPRQLPRPNVSPRAPFLPPLTLLLAQSFRRSPTASWLASGRSRPCPAPAAAMSSRQRGSSEAPRLWKLGPTQLFLGPPPKYQNLVLFRLV